MIGAGGHAYSDAEVEFPLVAEIQIDRGNKLLLLVVDGIKTRDGAVRAVILQAYGGALGDVVAELDVRRECVTPGGFGAAEGFVDGRIKSEIPAFDLVRRVDDGADFPGPGVGGDERALPSDFIGQAESDYPPELFRIRESRANVRADVVIAAVGLQGRKYVEACL